MKRHLLCLTVDTDPDGLSGRVTNRQTLKWEGLESLRSLPEELSACKLEGIPITWFVRADGQLESILGSATYLIEKYDDFWQKRQKAGDEIAWHPHLYRQSTPEDTAVLISDPPYAREELERLWDKLQSGFRPTAFRNGEGWHTAETFATVERFGFCCDSTAIPGRRGGQGHPMNWEDAPNQPYFPASNDLRNPGPVRPMLELPMNTWSLQGPQDKVPRTRYMNPAVHPRLFANALKNWENACDVLPPNLCIWVMIFHPDEVLTASGPDALYSRSTRDLCVNLMAIRDSLRRLGHAFEWLTVSGAAQRWRKHHQGMIG